MDHWNKLTGENNATFFSAITMYPEQFEQIFAEVKGTQKISEVPGIPRSTLRLPDQEKMLTHLEAQKDNSLPPVLNVLIQIDSRDVLSQLQQKGITRFIEANGALQFTHADERDIEIDALMTTPSLKQGGNDRQETAVARTIPTILAQLEQIVALNPDVVIRLIRGNFTTKVSGEVATALATSKNIPDSVRDRVVWYDYGNKGIYEDAPVEKY